MMKNTIRKIILNNGTRELVPITENIYERCIIMNKFNKYFKALYVSVESYITDNDIINIILDSDNNPLIYDNKYYIVQYNDNTSKYITIFPVTKLNKLIFKNMRNSPNFISKADLNKKITNTIKISYNEN
jgi:hypothetical protein